MKRSRVVLVVAAVLGVLAGLLVPLPDKVLWSTPFLVGLAVGELVFAGATLWHVFRTEQPETEEAMADADGGRTETDIVVVIGALASLAGIATVLASSGDKSVAPLEAAICLGAVAASWLAIHAVYTMRYARHYYVNERGCVDFNNDDKPSLADFAYLAYCLGMTLPGVRHRPEDQGRAAHRLLPHPALLRLRHGRDRLDDQPRHRHGPVTRSACPRARIAG